MPPAHQAAGRAGTLVVETYSNCCVLGPVILLDRRGVMRWGRRTVETYCKSVSFIDSLSSTIFHDRTVLKMVNHHQHKPMTTYHVVRYLPANENLWDVFMWESLLYSGISCNPWHPKIKHPGLSKWYPPCCLNAKCLPGSHGTKDQHWRHRHRIWVWGLRGMMGNMGCMRSMSRLESIWRPIFLTIYKSYKSCQYFHWVDILLHE